MQLHHDERVIVMIDGQSLNTTLKAMGFQIDYKSLLRLFKDRSRLVRALYYTTIVVQEEQPIRPLVDWLDYNGFTLVTKPAREAIDADGRRHIRGDMRVELAVDAMELAPGADHFVLFTGHASFRHLAAALQRKGKRVTVVSTLQTHPPMIADDMRRQADQFVDLADLVPLIGRTPPAAMRPAAPREMPPREAPPALSAPAILEPAREAERVDVESGDPDAPTRAGERAPARKSVVVEKRTTPRKPKA